MTEEQIKSLKKGDKFIIEYKVAEVRNPGIDVIDKTGERTLMDKHFSDALKLATLVTPPPTFEVGDTVRIAPDPMTGTVHGISNIDDQSCEFRIKDGAGVITELVPLDYACNVKVEGFECAMCIDIHCLELVKKVVKDKYIVEEDSLAWCVTDKNWSVCSFNKSNHPAAKAAAEAECARLNEAWRKQQEGGAE